MNDKKVFVPLALYDWHKVYKYGGLSAVSNWSGTCCPSEEYQTSELWTWYQKSPSWKSVIEIRTSSIHHTQTRNGQGWLENIQGNKISYLVQNWHYLVSSQNLNSWWISIHQFSILFLIFCPQQISCFTLEYEKSYECLFKLTWLWFLFNRLNEWLHFELTRARAKMHLLPGRDFLMKQLES